MKTFQPLMELHIRLLPTWRARSIVLGCFIAGVGSPKVVWAHPCVWAAHHRMPLHSEEAAVPWGSNFFLKAGIGAEVMKLEEFCFQALGDLTEWRNAGYSLLWRVGSDSVSTAMLAKRLHHGTASAQKKGENHCLLPRWSLQVTGRKFVQCSLLVIGVVH